MLNKFTFIIIILNEGAEAINVVMHYDLSLDGVGRGGVNGSIVSYLYINILLTEDSRTTEVYKFVFEPFSRTPPCFERKHPIKHIKYTQNTSKLTYTYIYTFAITSLGVFRISFKPPFDVAYSQNLKPVVCSHCAELS